MRFEKGDFLDRQYEVLSVHPGGMGVVYVLLDRESGELVAAKTVKEEARNNPRVLARFDREVRTWIGLGRHPNIVSALFVREIDGVPYLFLEYVEGPTLARILDADGPLQLSQAFDLALQCARGLTFAHEKPLGGGTTGLVHRDVKPENLFVTRERVLKVSDLGIAKLLAADLEATAEGIGMGTPWYASPEQLKSSRDVDGRADVYSFGAVLYEMLAGHLPLKADALESQIYMILRVRPEPPSRFNPRIPAALDQLVLSCLEKDRADRPGSFRIVSRMLRDIARHDRLEEIDPPASTCASCGYASSRTPAVCPVCGKRMGEPRAFSAALPNVGTRSLRPRPADLSIRSVDAVPRPVHVGEELTVSITVANRGTVAARRAELRYPVPDPDTFRLLTGDEVYRGEIPPGGSLEIRYGVVPLREGTFALPAPEIRFRGDGEEKAARGPEGLRIPVTFNVHLPLVGREKEWDLLTSSLGPKRAAFVLVEGEVGGGRSRFLDEAVRFLSDHGVKVIRGKALERAREPMKVFHDVAREVFGVGRTNLSASSLMARVIDRLASLVGEDPAMAAHFASFLRGAAVEEPQAGVRGYLWFRLLKALTQDGPVALVLDDLQWADEESIDLAETLVRRAHEVGLPFMIVGSTLFTDSEERTRQRIAWLTDRFSAIATNPGLGVRITLSALSKESVGRLLESVFPGNTLAEDNPWLLPALTALSGGNAFHAVQILKRLREARNEEGEPFVSAEGGTWTLRPEVTETWLSEFVPEAVEDMVRAVLRPLPAPAREVLDIAAAIGEEFEVSLLAAVRPGKDDLDEILDALEQADLVRSVDEGGERLRFTSSLVPSIVEGLVRERSRRSHARLHRALAKALAKTLTPRELRKTAVRYARHLLLGGEREKAFPWLVLAAEDFVRQQLFLRADAALVRAGQLLDERIRPAEGVLGNYYFLRGEVSRVTGNLTYALEALDLAVEHLSGGRGRTVLARVFGKMGKIHEVRGEIDRALFCYELGAQIREDLGSDAEMAHSLNNLGSLHLLKGEEEKAQEAFVRARDLARTSGNLFALGNALDNLAELETREGRWEGAQKLYRESLDLAEHSANRQGMARALTGLGRLRLLSGEVEGAREAWQQAIEIRREVGDKEGVASLLSNLGVIHDRRGEYGEALKYYRRSAEAHRAIGSRGGLATVLNNIGVVNLTRGDVGMAVERFEEALAIRRETGDRTRLALALENLGEALALTGEQERAVRVLDEALEAASGGGDPNLVASVRASRALVFHRVGDVGRAEQELAAGLVIEGRDPRVRASLHIEMAAVLFDRGDISGAERAVQRGSAHAEKAGDPIVRAEGLRISGLVRHARDDLLGAIDDLERAEQILEGTTGTDLFRVRLALALLVRERNRARGRELLMRARGLFDALAARGAVLPESEVLERALAEENAV